MNFKMNGYNTQHTHIAHTHTHTHTRTHTHTHSMQWFEWTRVYRNEHTSTARFMVLTGSWLVGIVGWSWMSVMMTWHQIGRSCHSPKRRNRIGIGTFNLFQLECFWRHVSLKHNVGQNKTKRGSLCVCVCCVCVCAVCVCVCVCLCVHVCVCCVCVCVCAVCVLCCLPE